MKRIIIVALVLTLVFSLTSCVKQVNSVDVPADFCFYIEWDCNGDSTYDSKTGRLVKQKSATKIEDYTTTFLLSDEQKAEIFSLISDMKPETYPDEYNPLKGVTEPTRNIIITASYNGKTKTITCMNVSLGNTPDCNKGKKFMAVHDKIVGIITSSAEWQALPDYEFYYD